MAPLRPLSDRVLIERVENEKTTPGGLIIPDAAQEKTQVGKVIAVGPGMALKDGSIRPMDLNIGDKVLFGKFSGTEINFDGTDFLILRQDDVLAVVS